MASAHHNSYAGPRLFSMMISHVSFVRWQKSTRDKFRRAGADTFDVLGAWSANRIGCCGLRSRQDREGAARTAAGAADFRIAFIVEGQQHGDPPLRVHSDRDFRYKPILLKKVSRSLGLCDSVRLILATTEAARVWRSGAVRTRAGVAGDRD